MSAKAEPAPLRGRRISASAGARTNDFVGCAPAGADGRLRPISLVCKMAEAEGRTAVKLSDNPYKALGPPNEIERYRRIFGVAGMVKRPVEV